MMKMFVVEFKRIGKYRDTRVLVEAPSIAELEEPLRAEIEDYELLPTDKHYTITYEELTGIGMLDSGLTGEFTVFQAP